MRTLAALGLDPEKLIRDFGTAGLFAIVFAESGLLVGFFLPGDSLLFTAGLLSATTYLLPPIWVLLIGCFAAAVTGDQVGYLFGRKVGPTLFAREDSRIFKKRYAIEAEEFFERHGSRTIVLARFVPIIRTFAPIVAGISRMRYRTFVMYNVIGAFLWAIGVTFLGWALGKRYPSLGDRIEILIPVIVFASLIPVAIEFLRKRPSRAKTG